MKRFLLFFLSALVFTTSKAQTDKSPSFDGYWAGVITTSAEDDDKVTMILKITNGVAKRVYYDKDTKSLETSDFLKESTSILRNNLTYTWMNKGGVWSETQTYMASYINKEKLQLIWARQVNNIGEDEDNEEWYLIGRGELLKYTEKELLEIFND